MIGPFTAIPSICNQRSLPGSRLEVDFDNTDFRLFWSGCIQTYENHFTIFSERNQVRISRADMNNRTIKIQRKGLDLFDTI